MPDIITKAERAAIDAAIAAGRVTKCQQGAMATAVQYVWEEGKGRTAGLYQADGGNEGWRARKQIQFGRRSKSEGQERRKRVKAMMLEGMTQATIARELSVSDKTVKNDINILRDAGELPPARHRSWRKIEAAEERRAKVLEMKRAGMKNAEIAAAFGVSVGTIKSDWAELRILEREAA